MTAEWVTAVATVGLLLTALSAAAVALHQLREARELRLSEYRADVSVHSEVRTSSNIMMLVVENFGRSPAVDIDVRFDPPLESELNSPVEIGSRSVWRASSVAPGQRLMTVWDKGANLNKPGVNTRHTVHVTYRSPATDGDELIRKTLVVDASQWMDAQEITLSGNRIKDIVDRLDALNQTLRE